jgi:hypothetical protein
MLKEIAGRARWTIWSTAFVFLAITSALNTAQAAENYLHARARLLASGLKPAPIPRGGKYDLCGISGEGDLCKRFQELVDCSGMGASAGSCRMAFVARDGHFVVVSAFGWEDPKTMVITGLARANATDTKMIKNLIAGNPAGD